MSCFLNDSSKNDESENLDRAEQLEKACHPHCTIHYLQRGHTLDGHSEHLGEQAHSDDWITFDNFGCINPESWALGSLETNDKEHNRG